MRLEGHNLDGWLDQLDAALSLCDSARAVDAMLSDGVTISRQDWEAAGNAQPPVPFVAVLGTPWGHVPVRLDG